MHRDVHPVVTGFRFLECPRWRDGRIWFSDFYTHQVCSATEDGGDLRVEAEVPHQPSGLGWLPDGRLLVVSMRDKRVLRREADGTLATHADLSGHAAGHLNDIVVDARGRAYVGNFGFDLMGGAPSEPANLLRADPDGTVTEVATGLGFPNGSVLTDDGVLIVGETFANRVSAFDVAADGALANRRTWASFREPPNVVAPDGCCLDAEGSLWIADATGNRVVRAREGGEIVEEIHPGTGVFACMLGGEDGRTLFLCTAPDYAEEAREAAREARLLAVRVDVPRAGLP